MNPLPLTGSGRVKDIKSILHKSNDSKDKQDKGNK